MVAPSDLWQADPSGRSQQDVPVCFAMATGRSLHVTVKALSELAGASLPRQPQS